MDQLTVRQMLEETKETFELWCDFSAEDSKKMKVRFDQLVERGFTQEQALDIIKARGIIL